MIHLYILVSGDQAQLPIAARPLHKSRCHLWYAVQISKRMSPTHKGLVSGIMHSFFVFFTFKTMSVTCGILCLSGFLLVPLRKV